MRRGGQATRGPPTTQRVAGRSYVCALLGVACAKARVRSAVPGQPHWLSVLGSLVGISSLIPAELVLLPRAWVLDLFVLHP